MSLSDAFRDALGDREAPPRVTLAGRTIVRWVAFHTPTAEWGRWGYRHADHHLRQFGA